MRKTLMTTLAVAAAGLAGFASSAGAQTVVSGSITSPTVWGDTAGECPIILNGVVTVTNTDPELQTPLTILPGCIVRGQPRRGPAPAADAPGSLIITQTGHLTAVGNGTSTGVIVFTTAATDNDNDGVADVQGGGDPNPGFLAGWDPGDTFYDDTPTTAPLAPLDANGASNVQLWGGLVLLGKAPVNVGTGCATATEGVCNVEGLAIPGISVSDTLYGGNEPHGSCGSLEYISVRHGGDQIGTDNEINGITIGGCGDGTEFNYIEVYANFDDGIEWFGGTVNGSHLHVAYVGDDMFDTDQGYTGINQFAFGVAPFFGEADGVTPGGSYGSASGDKIGEWDGDDFAETPGASVNCQPHSNVWFWNMTGIGSKQVGTPDFTPAPTDVDGVAGNRGIQMRNGFGGAIANSVIVNTTGALFDIDSTTGVACTGFDTADQVANCSTAQSYASTYDDDTTNTFAGDEALAMACGDDSIFVDCGAIGCNVVNPAFGFPGLTNADTSFNPQGDASGKLVASLKSAPIDPTFPLGGFVGIVGGRAPTNGALLDPTATYRGAFDSSLPTMWTDNWTVLSIAGLLDN